MPPGNPASFGSALPDFPQPAWSPFNATHKKRQSDPVNAGKAFRPAFGRSALQAKFISCAPLAARLWPSSPPGRRYESCYLTRVRRRWTSRTSTTTNRTPATMRTIDPVSIEFFLPRVKLTAKCPRAGAPVRRTARELFRGVRGACAAESFHPNGGGTCPPTASPKPCRGCARICATVFASEPYFTRLRRRCTSTTSTMAKSTPAITRTIVELSIIPLPLSRSRIEHF